MGPLPHNPFCPAPLSLEQLQICFSILCSLPARAEGVCSGWEGVKVLAPSPERGSGMDTPCPTLPSLVNPGSGPSVSVVSGLFFFFLAKIFCKRPGNRGME